MGELCGTLMKPSRGLPPTRCVGESGVSEFGMLRLPDRCKSAHQRVVFGVADLGLVENVVQMLVVAQFVAQFLHFARGIFH